MRQRPLANITWVSMAYTPTHPLDELTGPDLHNRCETPKCNQYPGLPPVAEHIEMLWDSSTAGLPVVVRAWKTCAACHNGMTESAAKEGA